ncbi:MAG: alpha-hydroxy-acid oxidizing protein [Acetobacteraceae bacterium]|nr:alpha-hydroxy-acid oxidizing protein [Acetobacteraceae bacterium]
MGISDTRRGLERSTTDLEATPVQGIVRAAPVALPTHLRRTLSLANFEAAAHRHLPRPIFGYVSGAAETNASLRDNLSAFEEFGFVPRVLIDVSKRTERVELFNRIYSAPFGIAPWASVLCPPTAAIWSWREQPGRRTFIW